MTHSRVPAASALAHGAWTGPLLIAPERDTDLERWAREHRAWIDAALLQHGALLFRGFDAESPAAFRRIAAALCDRLLDYSYRSTPRTNVDNKVYSATEYRSTSSIPMHNENSYHHDWPMRIMFCCQQPASEGGETPLALTAGVTRRIDPEIRAEFAAKGVMYVRNYSDGIDLSWQTTFQTESRAEMEDYCRRESIECEWVADDHLRTCQVCQAIADHPITGERLWFNQAHLFHASSLGAEDQAAMIELFGEANLPRHARFGDGSAIDERMLDHIRQAYEAEARAQPWHARDLLLAENMLVAHGRRPYRGSRTVLVAMGDAYSAVAARTAARAPDTHAPDAAHPLGAA